MSWRQRILRACTIIVDPAFRAAHAVRGVAYKSGLFHSYDAGVRVISVGNLATGEAGKTPWVIWLAFPPLCSRVQACGGESRVRRNQ